MQIEVACVLFVAEFIGNGLKRWAMQKRVSALGDVEVTRKQKGLLRVGKFTREKVNILIFIFKLFYYFFNYNNI